MRRVGEGVDVLPEGRTPLSGQRSSSISAHGGQKSQKDDLNPVRGLLLGSLLGLEVYACIAALLVLLMAGCATVGGPRDVGIPPEIGRRPTLVEASQIDRFAPKIIEAARAEGFTCLPVIFAISNKIPNDSMLTAARPSTRACPEFYIKVNASFLHRDSPDELAGTLAHELGHLMDRDWTLARSRTPQITREREADAISIRILRRIGPEACLVMVTHFKRVRAENIKAWGTEQRDTAGTHPSYTERIATFERDCHGVAR